MNKTSTTAAQRSLEYLLLIFLLINIFYFQKGGSNPASRMATLAAMSEFKSFETSSYKQWTADWAIRDNQYFSNKAPGPMLLAWPFYKIWEAFTVSSATTIEERNMKRYENLDRASFFLSLVLQCLPLLAILLYVIRGQTTSHNLGAATFFIMSVCFGSVGAFFFNTFFGHAFAVIGCLAFLIFLKEKKYVLSGFFMSLGILSDYGSILMLPAVLTALLFCECQSEGRLFSKKRQQDICRFLLGALPAFLLWCFYHTLCFGNPWSIANKYQNPVFQDQIGQKSQLWGILRLFPSWEIVRNLLWGSSRGILQTQSWALLGLAILSYLILRGRRRFETLFAIFFFVFLFYMNSSFGGWHGGASPGPRYLSAAFPAIAYALMGEWENIGATMKKLLWSALGFSLIFYAHVMSTSILMSGYPILEEAFNWVWKLSLFPFAKIKTVFLLIVFSALLWRQGVLVRK